MNTAQIVESVLSDTTEDEVREEVDEQMFEYIDSDWESEYESEYDCYIETCNGEAESDVLHRILRKYEADNQVTLSTDKFCAVYDELKEAWGL